MAELLIHKHDIPQETLDRLREEGVIAIKADDPNDFRFLSLEPPTISTDDFAWASLDALTACSLDTSKGAHRLVKNLSELAAKERLRC